MEPAAARKAVHVDAELRLVTDELREELRRAHPDLFDRRGRLRLKALSQRVIERLSGLRRLSGQDLNRLEDAADAGASRSGQAPDG